MSRYKVNGKNLSLTRLMPRGKTPDKRLKYLHVSPRGTFVTTSVIAARVTLPAGENPVMFAPEIISQEKIDAMPLRPVPGSEEIVELPVGEPGVTGPKFLVPKMDGLFPGPDKTEMTFVCNGDLLRKLLTVACEVTDDGDKTMKLRICDGGKRLRIDTYRQPGKQEFVGVLSRLDYSGPHVPGDMPGDVVAPEKKPQQTVMVLKASEGRRFRGERE